MRRAVDLASDLVVTSTCARMVVHISAAFLTDRLPVLLLQKTFHTIAIAIQPCCIERLRTPTTSYAYPYC
jgi:hypothetical protein